MPALKPAPVHPPAGLHGGKIDCPRCGGRYLDPQTLICLCSAEFTPEGLDYVRSLPLSLQRRT
ncbi:MAG: hypothetical protein EOP20_00700 [Hyphomicrobiales bacterium]|nr:MAG: hypothetical protein EOP20_00700 [Hyphomicrobiales bacterium]